MEPITNSERARFRALERRFYIFLWKEVGNPRNLNLNFCVVSLKFVYTTMTIKFVEFFIYIKILHIIVEINTVTLEVVPLEFNTLVPVSLPLLEAILEFFNCQCL